MLRRAFIRYYERRKISDAQFLTVHERVFAFVEALETAVWALL